MNHRSDENIRAVAALGLALLVVLGIVLGLVGIFQSTIEDGALQADSKAADDPGRRLPPSEPRLSEDLQGDLRRLFRQADSVLATYGVVDADSNIFRIPIDSAIRLLAAQLETIENGPSPQSAQFAMPDEAGTGPSSSAIRDPSALTDSDESVHSDLD